MFPVPPPGFIYMPYPPHAPPQVAAGSSSELGSSPTPGVSSLPPPHLIPYPPPPLFPPNLPALMSSPFSGHSYNHPPAVIQADNPRSYYIRHRNRVPWKLRRYVWGVVGLHEEIEDFIKFMQPTEAEQAMRDDVVWRIRQVVQELWVSSNSKGDKGLSFETYGP